MKIKGIEDLNRLYTQAETADQEVWAEMRSNILLVAGEHYSKKARGAFNRIRDSVKIDPEQKIRLTKNHIQKAMKMYVNNLLSMAPGVKVLPENDKETADVKSAEMHESVRNHFSRTLDIKKRTRDWATDFFWLGECGAFIRWNPMKGRKIGNYQKLDDMGQPMVDEMGNPIADESRPAFSGAFEVERLFGFNIFRAQDAQSMEESWFLGIRKLADKNELKLKYQGDDKKLKAIDGASGESFLVFDSSTTSYKDDDKSVLIREYYVRPSSEQPNGYFFITTSAGILEEGELPGGIFPIVTQTCEEFQTSPRGRSPIKHGRPIQSEINRAASKAAEHQITLGDDKLVLPNGSKVTQGAQLPGIRTIHTSGQAPVVIAGRTGDQFLPYITAQVDEFYRVMMIDEDLVVKGDGQMDPYAQLFKSMRQKKSFSLYADKFEEFLRKFWETFLELARFYLPEDEVIQIVGKRETVNISEYKNAKPIGYQIKVEAASEDIESMMGKQLTYNQILQYVGPQLPPDELGRVIANMPLLNKDQTFKDLTIDYENAVNDELMLERGQMPQLRKGVNHVYTRKSLTSRVKQSDFQMLDPQIQQAFDAYIAQLDQAIAEEQSAQMALNADAIPAQGFLTPCDFYVPDPNSPGNSKRARLPIDALAWLVQRLEQQGVTLQQLESLQPSAQADIANQAMQSSQGAQAQGSAGEFLAQPGQTTPTGVENGSPQ